VVEQPALSSASSGLSAEESCACAHHWRIESPAGETSEGVCQLCGATRSFANYSRHQAMSRTRKNQPSAASQA
jgi:hypothetical protein